MKRQAPITVISVSIPDPVATIRALLALQDRREARTAQQTKEQAA